MQTSRTHRARHPFKPSASSWLAGRVDTLPKSKTRLLPREPDSSLAFPGALRATNPATPRRIDHAPFAPITFSPPPRLRIRAPRTRVPFSPAPPDSPHDLPRRLHVLLPSYPTRSAGRPHRTSSGNAQRGSEVPEDPARAPSHSSTVCGAIETWRV